MSSSDVVMRKVVDLATSGVGMDDAREELLAAADGDRLALEVARAVIMRDGLPRHRPPAPRLRPKIGSLRNRTLNLLEYAMSGAPEAPDRGPEYTWNEVVFETWG